MLKSSERKGLGATRRRICQYDKTNIHTMVSAGLARSAAGARLPICGILEAAGVYIGERSLGLFRWRMYRWLRIKSAALYQELLPICRGIAMNHDETSMKLCIGDNRMKTLNIMVRPCSIFPESGQRFDCIPTLSRLHRKTALGIFSGLRLQSLDISWRCVSAISHFFRNA